MVPDHVAAAHGQAVRVASAHGVCWVLDQKPQVGDIVGLGLSFSKTCTRQLIRQRLVRQGKNVDLQDAATRLPYREEPVSAGGAYRSSWSILFFRVPP